jgi:ATP-dependent DNA helicase RecG
LILSQRFYRHLGKPGVYTRKRGLDQETNKALLLKHVTDSGKEGSAFNELIQVLPYLTRRQIQHLVKKLKEDGLIILKGSRKGSRYYRYHDEPKNASSAESG